MKFTAKTVKIEEIRTEGLVTGLFEGEKIKGSLAAIDKALDKKISRAVKAKVFEGKAGQVHVVDTMGRLPAGMVAFVGLGKKDDVSLETVRRAAAAGAKAMRREGVKRFATDLAQTPVKKTDTADLAQAVTEGAVLALYTFEKFKSEKSEKKVEAVTLTAASEKQEKAMAKGARKGRALAESASFARDLVNLPGNALTPSRLAEEARKTARRSKIKLSVLDPAGIKKQKMGGLMAVARGSREPARFIIMEWMKGPKKQKPIVLVGKGLTFDTGGISLKPSASMEQMKSDMSGGAAVIAAMRAAAALNLKVNLVGLVPATENMPGSSATKPGDVVTGLSGVTFEIINTDAEGRLILADALAYAERYKPDCVVDLATLTGACMVALGEYASGLFGTDEELVNAIKEAGEETGERVWPLPLWPEYEKLIKSDVADIKNVGPRWGGAITAAAFLKRNVKGKWAHVDIAGTAFTGKPRGYLTCGGTGVGVRLMIRFLEKRAKL
ncbi:MAG: leucyl aminopeptidase [Candidatus Nitrospinota bacterium M3_3B_026]